jgi:outer membrane protein assembly factor BamD (BamD/ComL family)
MNMRWTIARHLAIGGMLVALLCGCSTITETAADIKKSVIAFFGGLDENATAEELAIKGMEEYDDGSYKKSIEYFQKLKDIYPF